MCQGDLSLIEIEKLIERVDLGGRRLSEQLNGGKEASRRSKVSQVSPRMMDLKRDEEFHV